MPPFTNFPIEFIAPYVGSTEKKLLPARMKPLADELFSSWLTRLASYHCLKLHNFTKLVLPNEEIWNRDIDKLADISHIRKMQQHTGYTDEILFKTILREYEGKLYENHNSNGNNNWLMPIGIYHRTRKNFGLQMCPCCLKEDIEPYYRRQWRFSFVVVCSQHQILLHDCCPDCKNPIIFHRREMGKRNDVFNDSMIICPTCQLDWTSPNVISSSIQADFEIIKFQQMLIEVLENNWGFIKNFGRVHSILYFNGLRQIIKLLSVSKRSVKFREMVARVSRLSLPQIQSQTHIFDLLSVRNRCQTLQLTNWLFAEWAEKFIETSFATKTWSSVLLADSNDLPFWYWSIVNNFLTKSNYCVSETEIITGLAYLQKRKKIILPADLKKIFGKSDLLRKKGNSFKTYIYQQIKEHNKIVSHT